MNITTVGIDLAKSVFQVHGVDERGKVMVRKSVKRSELASIQNTAARCSTRAVGSTSWIIVTIIFTPTSSASSWSPDGS